MGSASEPHPDGRNNENTHVQQENSSNDNNDGHHDPDDDDDDGDILGHANLGTLRSFAVEASACGEAKEDTGACPVVSHTQASRVIALGFMGFRAT